MLQYWCIV